MAESKTSAWEMNQIDWDRAQFHVDLLGGKTDLSPKTKEALAMIQSTLQKTAQDILADLKEKETRGDIKIDPIFLVQALIDLQAAKNSLCVAIIAPRAAS